MTHDGIEAIRVALNKVEKSNTVTKFLEGSHCITKLGLYKTGMCGEKTFEVHDVVSHADLLLQLSLYASDGPFTLIVPFTLILNFLIFVLFETT